MPICTLGIDVQTKNVARVYILWYTVEQNWYTDVIYTVQVWINENTFEKIC